METSLERVGDNLNRALHCALAADSRVCLLGEDIRDPYGGAFKISRGLSSSYPESVISTPISEAGIIGVAAGLALCGDRPIVEIMFSDFIALGFDQIYNFAAKSVSMYGHRLPMHLVIRCPVGGNRGYGPTHSQSPQKHLLGIPHLALYELSQLHDSVTLVGQLLARGEPCILFEQKTLYAEHMYPAGQIDDLFAFDYLDPAGVFARVFIEDPDTADVVIITPGGLVPRAMAAARDLFLDLELRCQVVVPSRLHPLELDPVFALLSRVGRVCLADEGTAGGSWAETIAYQIYARMWGALSCPIAVVNSRPSVIPAAAHLEGTVVVQAGTIRHALMEVVHA